MVFSRALEDVHMNVEGRLMEMIGEAGRRLHTARSRNDQVATDLRLYGASGSLALVSAMRRCAGAVPARPSHAATLMPGFTHLQPAQPVTLGHHLLAYAEMLAATAAGSPTRARRNECPLGSGALAGTSLPIDRAATASALGFDRPTANSLDAVSDRDFALETLAAASIAAVHLSRLGEELVLWSTTEFGFVQPARSPPPAPRSCRRSATPTSPS